MYKQTREMICFHIYMFPFFFQLYNVLGAVSFLCTLMAEL